MVYLGLGNRLGVVEPHYRLPFLSWLPHGALADRYVRAFGRADHYYERFRTRPGLRRLVAACDSGTTPCRCSPSPAGFNGGDVVPGRRRRVPTPVLSALLPLVPTYIWVGFRTPRTPAGPPLTPGPRRV